MDPGLTIVLLGHSGVGKSASGNTILGRTVFESRKAFIPVTRQISEQTGSVFGKKISVIDTPAILTSEQEIRTLCENIQRSSRRKLFLVVVKIDRFTEEQQDAVEAAIRTIGDDGMKNCFMLFTHGDSLNSRSMSLVDFLNADPDSPLPGLVKRFAGTHVFNNENGGEEQVRELLEKSDRLLNGGRRIVLLGLPGAGKSSAGNTILGSDQFKSDCSFDPVTTETVSKSAIEEGRWVNVVDTPGFTAEGLTPKQLYSEIVKAIEKSSPGPHAFVIVVRIGRISEAEIKVFEILEKLFGRDAAKYTMVLFTRGDELGDRPIDDLIQSNSCVSKLVNMCGDRFCVFDKTKRGNRQQVKVLLNEIDEMVTANERDDEGYYTIERFYRAQDILLKIFVNWDKFLEWFKKKLGKIDEIFSANSTRYCTS